MLIKQVFIKTDVMKLISWEKTSMRKVKMVIILPAILLLILSLSGCTNEQNNEATTGNLDSRLFGTWLFTYGVIETTYTFYSDGTFSFNNGTLTGTYTTNNGKISFTYTNGDPITHTSNYSFTNNFTLNITDEYGETMTYTKR